MSDLTIVKEELLDLIEFKNNKKIIHTLTNLINQIPSNEIYDTFGELTQKDPEFYMMKIHPSIYPRIIKHFKNNYRQTMLEEYQGMSEYILNKYCLFKGEKINTKFYGSTFLGNIHFLGLIYLTNYRLINTGFQFKIKTISLSLWEVLIKKIIRSHREAMKESILKKYPKEAFEGNLGEWGYTIPIIDISSIQEKTGRKLSYFIKLEIKDKLKTHRVKIVPRKPLPNYPKEEFIKQREEVLDQIYQLLLKYQ